MNKKDALTRSNAETKVKNINSLRKNIDLKPTMKTITNE